MSNPEKEIYTDLLEKATGGVYFPEISGKERRIKLITENNKVEILYDGEIIFADTISPDYSSSDILAKKTIIALLVRGIYSYINNK